MWRGAASEDCDPPSPGRPWAPIWVPSPGTDMGWQMRAGAHGSRAWRGLPLLVLPGFPLEDGW